MSDGWSIKEKLYLASSVVKNGENNWASVSKVMRNMGDNNRAAEFFSQKNCAQQYSALVEAFALPRRKRTDMTPLSASSSEPSFLASQVVEKLKQQRMDELKRIIQQEQAQFRKMKKDIEMIKSGQLDHQLPIMLEQRLTMETSPSIIPKPSTSDEIIEVTSADTSASVLESPTRSVVEQELIETAKSPKLATTPRPAATPENAAVFSPVQQPEVKSVISSPKTPSNTLYPPSEFVSPSKTPSLLVVRPSSPLVSPSMSPSNASVAIQGALLSPTKSVSRSPPRLIENQSLQLILQKLRSPSPVAPPAATSESSGTSAMLKEMTEVVPVVELEKLPASQVAAAATAFEDSDSDEEEKPLATLKTPPVTATAAKPTEVAPSAPVEQPELAEKQAEPVRSPPKVEPLKIRMDTIEKHREKEPPPKRILPPRGKAAASSQRRKRNSGGSTTSSEASSTVRTPAPASASATSRSPLPVPAPFPDNETYRQWKKMILNVWSMAAGHRHASLFLQPVKDSIAPGYSKLVKRPVDLSTIKKNIENGTLTSTEQVRLDLLMMFANAVMYNATNTEVNQMARDMADDVLKHLDELLVPINAMFSGGGVEATKSLRSNRQRLAAAATPTTDIAPRRTQTSKRPRLHSDEDTTEKSAAKRQK